MEKYPGEEFIFLGDYLDPYPEEGISVDQAFDGLIDILSFKENNPGMVVLLFGNHDLHYLHSELEGSRLDWRHAARNEQCFREHMQAFQLAHERTVAGKRYLFTHAGVGKKWLETYISTIPEESITAEMFNNWYRLPSFIRALSDVSYFRWGGCEFGSMVWADLQEQGVQENQLQSLVQVFGHTMVTTPFNYENRIYGLDCQRSFYLDLNDGGIYDLDSEKLVPTV